MLPSVRCRANWTGMSSRGQSDLQWWTLAICRACPSSPRANAPTQSPGKWTVSFRCAASQASFSHTQAERALSDRSANAY